MSTILPTKSSSRAGRFKKKLVPEAFLEKEAPVIQDRMTPVLHDFKAGKLSSAEFTAVYLLTVLSYRHPGTWLGAKAQAPVVQYQVLNYPLDHLKKTWEPNIQRRLEGVQTIGEVLNHFAFKSTPLTVNRSILSWSTGDYGLELMFRIPRPEEVLDQQKRGRRCVTIVLEPEKASKFILGERDALGFTMHDLIHADHFYHHNHCYQGQLGFYGFLDFCMKEKHFEELMMNPQFEAEFEYLISDMNAYAIHLMKCFKSALIHYHPTKEVFFDRWLTQFPLKEREKDAFNHLNSQNHGPQDDEILLSFLEGFKQSQLA